MGKGTKHKITEVEQKRNKLILILGAICVLFVVFAFFFGYSNGARRGGLNMFVESGKNMNPFVYCQIHEDINATICGDAVDQGNCIENSEDMLAYSIDMWGHYWSGYPDNRYAFEASLE